MVPLGQYEYKNNEMQCTVKYQFLIDIILATFIHVNISEPQQNIRKYIINQEQPTNYRVWYF